MGTRTEKSGSQAASMSGTSVSILVIRGGAIGDFLLTLPALRLLREGFPAARIEVVGYRHICALAEGRFYVDASKSIEYAPMAGFFSPRSDLDPGLSAYFSGFDQVVSYLYDPDGFFAGNLARCGVKNLLCGDPLIAGPDHAARQLARPLESLALFLDDHAARFFPHEGDLAAADNLLAPFFAMDGLQPPLLAVHPGSGSPKKNWPTDSWRQLLASLIAEGIRVLVIGGESDAARLQELRSLPGKQPVFLENLPLPVLGAVLGRCGYFLGHDSGISHLAAAAGARCLLLFGPTDPAVWAPSNPDVTILRAPGGSLSDLTVEEVGKEIRRLLP